MNSSDEKVEKGYNATHTDDVDQKPLSAAVNTKTGDQLLPEPSSDPRDPLVRHMFASYHGPVPTLTACVEI